MIVENIKEWFSNERLWWRLRAQWRRARHYALQAEEVGQGKEGKALIVPCDPWSVVGSRGDQAMIIACIQNIRAAHPERTIEIMVDSHETDDDCRALGMEPMMTWNEPIDTWFKVHASEYSEVYIPGADVTDGVYGWPVAMKMLAFYDLFWRKVMKVGQGRQRNVHYLGFSWSKTPNNMMKRVMCELTPGLPLPIRDPVSYERLAAFTKHRPIVQVADAAFCLKPHESARVAVHRAWVEAQHLAGKLVIALNVHTMFNDRETKSAEWENAFVGVLKGVQAVQPEVRFLFLPHDNRPGRSDYAILKRLYTAFDPVRAYLVNEVMDADEIKALIGACDGLIAGRMHISIAAMGQGVPVLGMVYQGKFEGLWQYFGLPSETLLEPGVFLRDQERACRTIGAFIHNLSSLRTQILGNLPAVLKQSGLNFNCPSSPSAFA